MTCYAVCESCSRHVRRESVECPFCGGAIPACAPKARRARERRAVLFAAGAAGALSLAGCGETVPVYGAPAPPIDAGLNDGGDETSDAQPPRGTREDAGTG